ncbi:terpene synthase family protein [Streptomyces microflavus]|uniref:terpene synthase family protein n=1 Tax=Streptomyces microflavus TaxID=1919 RepID=UPI00382C8AA8
MMEAEPPIYPEVLERGAGIEQRSIASSLRVATPSPAKHPRIEDLEIMLRKWLLETDILPSQSQEGDASIMARCAVERYLGQRHVDLIATAWGDARFGPHLEAAAKWLVITWVIDDHFDDVWIHTSAEDASPVISALEDILAGLHTPGPESHPLVKAFTSLWDETVTLTDTSWQLRYRRYYTDYLEAALLNLSEFEQPGKVPSTAEYLNRRDRDGGLLCTAGWIELAYSLRIPDEVFHQPQVFDLLMRFNHIICWVNDLYSAPVEAMAGSGKNLISCSMAYDNLTRDQAAARVIELCNAELCTFEFLAKSLRDPDWSSDVLAFIQYLTTFTRALIDWTAASRRYMTAAQTANED